MIPPDGGGKGCSDIRVNPLGSVALLAAATMAGFSGAALGEVSAAVTAGTGVVLGSVGKGAIKWQEKHSVAQAVAEGTTELLINTTSLLLRSSLTGRLEKIAVGLLFGMAKGGIKYGIAASQNGLAGNSPEQKPIAGAIYSAGRKGHAQRDRQGSCRNADEGSKRHDPSHGCSETLC